MKSLLAIALLFSPMMAHASGSSVSQRVVSHRAEIEGSIEKSLKSQLGQIRGFIVDWKSLRCVTGRWVDTDNPIGTCVIGAGAFQVVSQFAINVTYDSIKIEPLFIDID